MTQAIIYARFSPRRNAEDCQSIETQLDICRAYCRKNGYEIAGEFTDRALSGSDEDRPGLWAAVEALRRGIVLIVYRLDRLARSVYLSHLIEREAAKKGAKILSICGEGTWDEGDDQWLIRKILQTLAEYERRVTAARTKAAMLRHQANGRRMGGVAPFGTRSDGDRLVFDPDEQQTIARIRELHAAGKGAKEIADTLQAEGRRPRGQRWYHVSVTRILQRTDHDSNGLALAAQTANEEAKTSA